MKEGRITIAGMLLAWEAAKMSGPEVLDAIYATNEEDLDWDSEDTDQRSYDLMEGVIRGWYDDKDQLFQLVDDLKKVPGIMKRYHDSDKCLDRELLRCLIEKLTSQIKIRGGEWSDIMPRIKFLFELAEQSSENSENMELLVAACGERLTLLTAEQEQEMLPKVDDFREAYAHGVQSKKKCAFRAHQFYRKTTTTAAGKSEKEGPHTVEDIGDVVLNLMQLPSSNGHANDMIVKLMERIGGMPGGGEELERIEREAPNYRKTQPE